MVLPDTKDNEDATPKQNPDRQGGAPSKEWPQKVLDLAGAWPDFPTVEEIRKSYEQKSGKNILD